MLSTENTPTAPKTATPEPAKTGPDYTLAPKPGSFRHVLQRFDMDAHSREHWISYDMNIEARPYSHRGRLASTLFMPLSPDGGDSNFERATKLGWLDITEQVREDHPELFRMPAEEEKHTLPDDHATAVAEQAIRDCAGDPRKLEGVVREMGGALSEAGTALRDASEAVGKAVQGADANARAAAELEALNDDLQQRLAAAGRVTSGDLATINTLRRALHDVEQALGSGDVAAAQAVLAREAVVTARTFVPDDEADLGPFEEVTVDGAQPRWVDEVEASVQAAREAEQAGEGQAPESKPETKAKKAKNKPKE